MAMDYRILTLDYRSRRGVARLAGARYECGLRVTNPDATLVRSADLHGFAVAPGVRAIGRAGAGLTNPVGRVPLGGRRASLYNAVPLEGVQALDACMKEFERRHG